MTLTLYIRDFCPFCAKVMSFLKENKMEMEVKRINADDQARQELVTGGGKSQVPCLFIDGKPLYESDDIIQWLKDNIKKDV